MRTRYFIAFFSWRFENITKSYQKGFMRRKTILHWKSEFCYNWRKEKLGYQLPLCDTLTQKNVRKLFKPADDFGQVIQKTEVNVSFLFKLRFHRD